MTIGVEDGYRRNKPQFQKEVIPQESNSKNYQYQGVIPEESYPSSKSISTIFNSVKDP
jgi:hypothetical protein